MANFYGKIEGSVRVNGQPATRELVAISFDKVDTGEVDSEGAPIFERRVVGSSVSSEDGSYELRMDGFEGAAIVVAVDNYGEAWLPNRSLAVGDLIRPTKGNETGYVYRVTLAGVSDATEPTWWINNGGATSGNIGTAVAEAVESWAPIAHAPLTPTRVDTVELILPLELDPYFNNRVAALNFNGDLVDYSQTPRTWTNAGAGFSIEAAAKFGSAAMEFSTESRQLISIDNTSFDSTNLFEASEDFAVAFWAYPIASSNAYARVFQTSDGDVVTGMSIALDPSGNWWLGATFGIVGQSSWSAVGDAFSLALAEWAHIVYQRKNGVIRQFKNGLQQGADIFYDSAIPLGRSGDISSTIVGGQATGAQRTVNGRIDDLQILKGIAAFDHDGFAPPTEPFSETRFAAGREPTILDPFFAKVVSLLSFDAEDINDTDAVDTITAVDWTFEGSSSVQPGGASGNALSVGSANADRISTSDIEAIGSGEYTIELFLSASGNLGNHILLDTRSGQTNGRYPMLWTNSSGQLIFYFDSADRITGTTNVRDGVLRHVALCRKDGVTRLFAAGSQEGGDYADTNEYLVGLLTCLGGSNAGFGSLKGWGGLIDGFRFTRAARYTEDFDPPAAPLPVFEYDPNENLAATEPAE
ncbi:MAG: LamG-like jellyroll fold domain-containing protein [Pseudomonadota bacterium]